MSNPPVDGDPPAGGEPPENIWEGALLPESEPQPTCCTLGQLRTGYEMWTQSIRLKEQQNVGTLPETEKSLLEFIREQVPEEDRGDPEGKAYITLRPEDVTEIPGHEYGIVVRSETAIMLERFFSESNHQQTFIASEFRVATEKTYMQLGSLGAEGQVPTPTIRGWAAASSTQSWPGSPKTLAVGNKIAEAIRNDNCIIIEIGKPLEDSSAIFRNLGNPNQ